jgi:hypothetical protein
MLTDATDRPVPATPLAWLESLGAPAVVRVAGRDRSRCRGVSVLLHGDEPSGLVALHAYLQSGAVPATDVVATIGAVDAARAAPPFSHRFLPDRRDLNRCFPGGDGDVDARLARDIHGALSARGPELVVDLHNNSGKNPCYGVVHGLDDARLRVVGLFSNLVMHADRHLGTLNDAFAGNTTSLTIECGQSQDEAAHAHATDRLARLLAVDDLASLPVPSFEVFTGNLRVRVRDDVTLAFGVRALAGQDLTLLPDLDRFNFKTLPRGTPVGFVGPKKKWPFLALDDDGRDVSPDLFALDGELLVAAADLVPAMLTTSVRAVRADCLTYLVARTVRPGRG